MSDCADPLGAKASEGPASPYDRCKGKPEESLSHERSKRTRSPYFLLRLWPPIVVVTLIDNCTCIMRIRPKHNLGYMSAVAVYASNEMCETEGKMFYGKLDSVLDQCLCRHALIVLGYFMVMRELTTNNVLTPMTLIPGQQQISPFESSKFQKV